MCRIFIVLLVLSLSSIAHANSHNDRVIRITAQNDTLVQQDDGSWVPYGPYVLEPLDVWAERPIAGESYCFVMEDLFVSHGATGWYLCENGEDWEPIIEPTLMIIPDGKLDIGDFISSDINHKVKAEIADINTVGEWQGYANEGHSNSGILEFDPKTAKQPKIKFRPESVVDEVGRPNLINS